MDAFDFDPPKSRSYYNRPRKPGRGPWFWVAVTACTGILSVCILSGLAARYGPRTPRAELDSPTRVLAHLSAAGIPDDQLGKLKIYGLDSPSAARVAATEGGPTTCCTWGRWLVVGPPDVVRKVRAATADVEPPP